VSDEILGRSSPVHWAYLVASTCVPEMRDGRMRIDAIPGDLDEALIDETLRLIERYAEPTDAGS
jgi:hypothetical protein